MPGECQAPGRAVLLRVYVVAFEPVVFGGSGGPINDMAAAGTHCATLSGSPEEMIHTLCASNPTVRASIGLDVTAYIGLAPGQFQVELGDATCRGAFTVAEDGKSLRFQAGYERDRVRRVVSGEMPTNQRGVFAAMMKDAEYQAPHAEITMLLVTLAEPIAR